MTRLTNLKVEKKERARSKEDAKVSEIKSGFSRTPKVRVIRRVLSPALGAERRATKLRPAIGL
jgi:hypothetical protein